VGQGGVPCLGLNEASACTVCSLLACLLARTASPCAVGAALPAWTVVRCCTPTQVPRLPGPWPTRPWPLQLDTNLDGYSRRTVAFMLLHGTKHPW